MDGAPGNAPRLLTEDMLETRVDFEKGMSVVPPVTIALILLCAAVFARQTVMGTAFATEALIMPGSMVAERVLAGEWWRLVTAMFLHGSFEHLIGNMAALFILGMGCEHAFGGARTLAIYVVAGVAGFAAGLGHAARSVGASGAIFGLLGLLAAALYSNRGRLVVRDQRLPVVLLVWAVYQLVFGALNPIVDNMAHAGGFVAGLALGRVLAPCVLGRPGPGAAAGAAGAAALVACSLWRLRAAMP